MIFSNRGLKSEIAAATTTATTTTTNNNNNNFWVHVKAEDVCFDMFGLQFDVSQNQ
jgi:phenylpyruvate tautomerase PptA (4-oxalocrotonate tautomerase family)